MSDTITNENLVRELLVLRGVALHAAQARPCCALEWTEVRLNLEAMLLLLGHVTPMDTF